MATIKDVAEMAGCSIATVSRAFSAPEKLRPETLVKIEHAAKCCNYAPNAIARAMVLQRNKTIAFVIHEKHYPIMQNPFYAAISEAVQQEAEKNGYTVYIVSSKTFANSAMSMFANRSVDGVILAGQCEQMLLDVLQRQSAPVVLVNSQSVHDDIPSVTADDYDGSLQAVEHLIHRGHTRIGLLGGNLYPYVASARQNAFIDTMAKYDLPILPRYVRSCDANISSALSMATEMFSMENRPTALFCMNDVLAVGAIKAALRLQLHIPEDLAIVGYDDSNICQVIEPELTSVSVDTHRMGRESVNALIAKINGEQPGHIHLCLKTELIERQSS